MIVNSLNRNEFMYSYYHQSDTFTREMIGLDAGDVIKVGEIENEKSLRVDHDAYGLLL